MFVVRDEIVIRAPLGRSFALSCSLAVVELELHMHPVAGVDAASQTPYRTRGLVQGGDRVRWEGWQLGLPQTHVSLISGYQANRFLQDTMIEGRFREFQHDHHFRSESGVTRLEDEIRFSLPLGFAGRAVGALIMVPHIRRLLHRRFHLLKRLAEGNGWQQFLPAS